MDGGDVLILNLNTADFMPFSVAWFVKFNGFGFVSHLKFGG